MTLGALVLVVGLLSVMVPAPASASHCTDQGMAGIGRASVCDNNRDTVPDQTVVVVEAAPVAIDVAAYRQEYSNAEFVLARVAVSTGVPYAPIVYHSSRFDDNDGSGRFERSVHNGGVYTSGSGSGDVTYLVVLRDQNENLQIEDEDVLVCETFESGCHVLV